VNRSILVSVALAAAATAACGPGKTTTQPAPFPGTTGDVPAVEPPAGPTPTEPPMTQTAQPQELAFPDEPFRAEQPKPAAQRPFNLPKMKPFTLKNGIKVYLVEQHTLPIVSVELNLDGGGIADPDGKEGLASVCMAMLTEGTERLDKIAFSEALADIASSVSAFAGDDTQGVAMNTLTKHFETTFALFVETIRTPGFRAAELERLVKRRIEGVRQAKASPASISNRVSGAVLYGPTHPLGAVTTETSLASITLDDCKAYHKKWLKPRGARLFVVGDMTEGQIRQYFDGTALAGWTGAVPAAPGVVAPKTMPGRVFLVDVPGAAQSQIGLMHFGPKRTAPDYFQTTVMSSILGGGFASRVNMNLREDKGYSYGARAFFNYTRQYGTFGAGAGVRTDSTYQALLELRREIGELQANKTPVKEKEELEREKNGLVLGLPGRFATGSSSLGQFRGLVYFGLPLDYYNSFVGKVSKVSAAQVTAAAKKHLKPNEIVYVVVGDASAKMIKRVEVPGADGKIEKKDVPLEQDGKQLTLREALADGLASGVLGKGELVLLDADGKRL
jgi:predicted Zn-dependent peptidase